MDMSQPAIAPPAGVVADLDHPTDVLRTINFVTQALTLVLCSVFVFIRGAQKFRMAKPRVFVDDCGFLQDSAPWANKRSKGIFLFSGARFELTLDLFLCADLTLLSWLFIVAFCVSIIFSMYTH